MALDPRIALAGRPGQFSLQDFATGMQQGQQLIAGQRELSEQERLLAEQEAIRQAYAQQYGGGGAPPGLAGAQPMQPPGPEAPVQDRQLGGGPTANAPYATPPPGGPQAPQGLAGVQPMTKADQQSQRGFIDKLYTISPKAGREAENHAYTAQKQQYEANKERVEYLGRIANGVLDSPNPQQAWTVARAMLIEAGMPPSQAPEVLDLNYVRQLSAMSLDAKDKYNAGILQLQQAKEQRERNELASKVPNYGLDKDANAVMHEMFGAQIPPGSAPTPAMTQRVNAELIRREREADAAKQAETIRHHRAIEGTQQATAGRQVSKEQFDQEDKLRNDFIAQTKPYQTQADFYGRIQAAATDPSATGDLAVIYSYMKLLDPGSTVLSGEYATAQSAGSVPQRIIGHYNRLLNGERLSPEIRKDFVDRSTRLYEQSTKDYERTKKVFEDRSQRYGLNPANVVQDLGSTAARQQPGASGQGTPPSEADIAYYMQEWGKTRQEVLDAVRATGSSVPAR